MRRLALPLVLVLTLGSSGCARVLYNYAPVEEHKIYRSAQPSPLFLRTKLPKLGIRTLVNLRGDTPGFESAFAAERGLRLFSFDLSASRPPTDAQVERFLAVLQDPRNYPLLVHCRNGVDRTGYVVGIYRTAVQGLSKQAATREMNHFFQFSWFNAVPQAVVRDDLRGSPRQ